MALAEGVSEGDTERCRPLQWLAGARGVVVIVEARFGLLECAVGAAETFAGVLLSS